MIIRIVDVIPIPLLLLLLLLLMLDFLYFFLFFFFELQLRMAIFVVLYKYPVLRMCILCYVWFCRLNCFRYRRLYIVITKYTISNSTIVAIRRQLMLVEQHYQLKSQCYKLLLLVFLFCFRSRSLSFIFFSSLDNEIRTNSIYYTTIFFSATAKYHFQYK